MVLARLSLDTAECRLQYLTRTNSPPSCHQEYSGRERMESMVPSLLDAGSCSPTLHDFDYSTGLATKMIAAVINDVDPRRLWYIDC